MSVSIDLNFAIAFVGVLAAITSAVFAYPAWDAWMTQRILKRTFGARFFSQDEIERSTQYYVQPDCSSVDPSQEAELRHVLAVRNELFKSIDDFLVSGSPHRHLLLLADSGMGKTSALLNYYARNQKRRWSHHHIAIVPLGRPDVDEYIIGIRDKANTVMFLDALDEDTKAIEDHRGRVADLLTLCRDFRRVVITCRTQFFPNDEEIPVETGIVRVGPRKAGETGEYVFKKLYLSALNDGQVAWYLRKRYPFWRWLQRRRAFKAVKAVPLLSVRPMLLAYIPDFLASHMAIETSSELYEALVNAWYQRETYWVKPDQLRRFSELLAANIFDNRAARESEYISDSELSDLADFWGIKLKAWQLRGRSLLNRDALGNYKFAHRSIMEFLYVKYYLSSNDRRMPYEVTDQMDAFWWELTYLKFDVLTQAIRSRRISIKNGPRNVDFVGINLSRADLRGANLSGMNLRDASLHEADLQGADFRRTNLVKTDLSGASLSGANLSGMDLSAMNLRGADLRGAVLSAANLSKADLSNVNLNKADLSNANLSNANLSNASLNNANLSNAALRGAVLHGTGLSGIALSGAELSGIDLSGVDLSGVDLSRAVLDGAILSRADLREADLRGANLRKADLNGADLRKADLSGADLHEVVLRRAVLDGAALRGAKLSEAILSYASLGKAVLSEANLNRADLSRADLFRADLSGANLSEAVLGGANLRFANLRDAILSKADLSETVLRGAVLHGTDLSGADLSGAILLGAYVSGENQIVTFERVVDLQGAHYNESTRWPEGFVPSGYGAILKALLTVNDISKP